MPLHQYEVDFSQLTLDERTVLMDRIEKMSFNGLHWKSGFQSAIFFVDEDFDVSFLNVPACCSLRRVP